MRRLRDQITLREHTCSGSDCLDNFLGYSVAFKPQPTLSVNTNKTVSLLFTRRFTLYVFNKAGPTIQPTIFKAFQSTQIGTKIFVIGIESKLLFQCGRVEYFEFLLCTAELTSCFITCAKLYIG